MNFIYGKDANKNDFTLISDAGSEGASIRMPHHTVSGVGISVKFRKNTLGGYQAKLSVVSSIPSSAAFLGFRLSSPIGGAISDGIWLAIRNNKIGMRVGSWPGTEYLDIPHGITFEKERFLYVTDDTEKNIITLFADDDNGDRIKIARLTVSGCTLKLCAGEDNTELTEVLTSEPLSTGYMNIWVHHVENDVVVSELSASGTKEDSSEIISANMLASRDNFEDTWVSTDNEGRHTAQVTKAPNDKKVGIFYFLWHNGTSSQPIYDHSAAYYSGGAKKLEEVIKQGPLGFAHYWAEPYFGYYRSDDEWVLRKHANQLTAAGIDFIYFDFTNGLIYERNLEALLSIWSQMRLEGQQVPKIAFTLGDNPSCARSSFNALYSSLFSTDRYSDMWFLWDGKPLLLAPPSFTDTLSEEIKSKFTFRRCWAYTKDEPGKWFTNTDGKGCWPWADMYPQKFGRSPDGKNEQMIVMCGFWVNGSYGTNGGRSYANGSHPELSPTEYSFDLTYKTSGKGLGFQEQFTHAIDSDPEIIMVTGWNEWWAGRWEAGPAIGQTIVDTYTVTPDHELYKNYFVDCFSPEYSRDVEPVKGLYNDNYYYQLVQNSRKFKGTRAPQTVFGQKTIDINGDISQWYSVGPEYRDHIGDTAHRNCMSYVGQIHYANDSGRNDFVNTKISSDIDSLYFLAECASEITAPEGTNWMNLFIDSDANASTGWYGYDYIINRSQNGHKCSVEKFVGGKWELISVGDAEFTLNGKYIMIKISRDIIPFGETFDFKWADNSVSDGDIMQFVDLGDTAPSDRFNYRYTAAPQPKKLPDILTDSMIVLKAGSYNAYIGKKSVMLDENNTNAVMMGIGDAVYLPESFCKNTLGINTSSLRTLERCGVKFVNIKTSLDSLGKTVTFGENIIVLSDRKMTNNELLLLYRSLY